MLKVYNQNLEPLAILDNAFNVGYEKGTNEVGGAGFSLPLNDPKSIYCESLNYVDIPGKGLHRIMPHTSQRDEQKNIISFECEHVLSVLLDDVLFLKHHLGRNATTREHIEYILERQTVKHFVLGECDFTRYFEYKWENENLLSALFSIPKPFDENYRWQTDTSTYPWKINLVKPSTNIEAEIRYGKNLKGIERFETPTDIVTRIYPLGSAEGINQVRIDSVNPTGLPYIDSDNSIANGGTQKIRSYIWVDRRFESPQSLYDNALALLNEWKVPKVTYAIDVVDLSELPEYENLDQLEEGNLVRIVDPDFGTFEARVVKESKGDMLGKPQGIQLEIANKLDDFATTQADQERRIRINEVYAQGATNIDSRDFADNADADHPAIMEFWVEDDIKDINTMKLTFKTMKFRAYEKAALSTPQKVVTSGGGGGTSVTSSSGGGTSTTSGSGGGTTTTSGSGGGTTTTTSSRIFGFLSVESEPPYPYTDISNHRHEVQFTSEFDHNHSITLSAHTHSITISAHTHTITISPHTHTITLSPHTHQIIIPAHGHELDFGIYELEDTPTSVTIEVDGQIIPFNETNGENIDLTPFLKKDSNGDIERNRYIVIKLTPNERARIVATVVTRLFISSHKGENL